MVLRHILIGSVTVAPLIGFAEVDDNVLDLPAVEVREERVALIEPAGTFSSPVTSLRYEPLVDLQTRNIGEAQGDVTVRGGIFENTGFKVGALNLFDPQTGHYFAEIPIDPRYLSSPDVMTGVRNTREGFNSAVATIAYGFTPTTDYNEVSAGFGQYDYNEQRIAFGRKLENVFGKADLGVELSFARSEGEGTRDYQDHDFARYNLRLQLIGENSQTDFLAGYQSKFFGSPNMYTTFYPVLGNAETENIKTTLFLINHLQGYGDGSSFEIGAYSRRNVDDYELDRAAPTNDYEHETKVYTVQGQGTHRFDSFDLKYSALFLADEIDSSNLENGPFTSRSYYRLAVTPEKRFTVDANRDVVVTLGVAYDDSNRDEASWSPVAGIALEQQRVNGTDRFYLEYAKATQVPGYQVVGASRTSGLFRGNPDAGRERSHNLELGWDFTRDNYYGHAAIFYRRDRDLQDWTYDLSAPFVNTVARIANPVDIDTLGFETYAGAKYGAWDIVLGYTFLRKDEDYGIAGVDGSFYALNYPNHRTTASVIWTLSEQVSVFWDNEFRIQEDNPLRTEGGDEAYITSMGITYYPQSIPGFEVSLIGDNLTNSNFQEVPGTPSVRRHFSVTGTYRW